MRVSCDGIWSVHTGNTQWNFRAQDTQHTRLLCLVAWCCCMNGSVFSTAMVTQGLPGTQGEHHQPSFGPVPSCLGLPCQAQGAFQGGASPRHLPCTRECLDNQHFQFAEKDVLGYQTVLGMQINWCNCKIKSVNSCKIKTFSEILPGSQVHWATVTLPPLKRSKVEWHVQPYEIWA